MKQVLQSQATDLHTQALPTQAPPSITRLEAHLARSFACTRVLGPLAGPRVRVVPAPPPDRDAVLIDVHFAAGTARLAAPLAMLGQFLGTLDPACMGAQLPWTTLLLELAADTTLAALSQEHPTLAVRLLPALRQMATPPAHGSSPPAPETLPHALGLESDGVTARLDMDDGAARSIADALGTVLPQRHKLPGLTTLLHARALSATVGLADLRQAAPGHVILAEAPPDGGILLVAGDRLVWHASHESGRLHVTSARRTMQSGQEDEWMQDDTQDAGLDDLPVRLSFELGRLEVSLAELEALGPGHVFELDRGEQDAVEILANGRRIGAGRVVLVAGVPGVQITRLGVRGSPAR